MSLATIFIGVAVSWSIAETAMGIGRRARGAESAGRDRGSLLVLWALITVGIGAGFWLTQVRLAPFPVRESPRLMIAIAVMLGGIALRVWAILTLGRLFTMNVAIRDGHKLIENGPFRVLRHPSYSGLLAAFFGMGIGIGDALALAAIIVPIIVGLVYRIHVEERALRASFGEAWNAYAARRWRLVPGIY